MVVKNVMQIFHKIISDETIGGEFIILVGYFNQLRIVLDKLV